MAYFTPPLDAVVEDLGMTADPGDTWDGYTIMPIETEAGSGIKITATSNRDIMCKVAGLMVPFDSLTVNTTEDIKPMHGASRARAYALVGGDIDSTYSVEFGSWLSTGEVDAMREALFAGPHGEAVYHTLYVTFLGDPAKGYAGRHTLLTLFKCKAKADTWTFTQGTPNKGKFDGLAIEYFWYGRI